MTQNGSDESSGLGVLTPNSARTIVVIGADGELAVALHDRIERAYAIIRDLRPEEATIGINACLPWPWLVIGGVGTLEEETIESLRHRPILIYWRGDPPPGLPNHTRVFERFSDLSTAVNEALTQQVCGMKLAVGLGVDLPDGSFARSAELQALVSNHPHSFDVPLDAFRSAARVLSTHNVPQKPVRDPVSGNVLLVDANVGVPS